MTAAPHIQSCFTDHRASCRSDFLALIFISVVLPSPPTNHCSLLSSVAHKAGRTSPKGALPREGLHEPTLPPAGLGWRNQWWQKNTWEPQGGARGLGKNMKASRGRQRAQKIERCSKRFYSKITGIRVLICWAVKQTLIYVSIVCKTCLQKQANTLLCPAQPPRPQHDPPPPGLQDNE